MNYLYVFIMFGMFALFFFLELFPCYGKKQQQQRHLKFIFR